MRLMYLDSGIIRESKELIRHRVFMTKLMLGMQEEYKRRHDELAASRGGPVNPGPDNNFSIWNAGEYIFGYDEIDVTMEAEGTEASRDAVIRWETQMLEIMRWLTDDVDWLTGSGIRTRRESGGTAERLGSVFGALTKILTVISGCHALAFLKGLNKVARAAEAAEGRDLSDRLRGASKKRFCIGKAPRDEIFIRTEPGLLLEAVGEIVFTDAESPAEFVQRKCRGKIFLQIVEGISDKRGEHVIASLSRFFQMDQVIGA